MSVILLVFILSALAFQVFPVSLGTDIKQNFLKSLTIIISLTLMQALMFWLGIIVGKQFLHLSSGYANIVVFIGFFLVGIRIAMESFAIRKGERTYNTNNNQNIVLASVAQSINTFLAGMIFYYFSFGELFLVAIVLMLAALFSLAGSLIKLNKQSLAFSSLAYLLGGAGMVVSSVYLGFFTELFK